MRASKRATIALAFFFLPLVVFTSPAAGSSFGSTLPGFLAEGVLGVGNLLDNVVGTEFNLSPRGIGTNPNFSPQGNSFESFSVTGNEFSGTFLFGVPPAQGLWSVESGAAVLSPNGLFQADVIGLAVDGFIASDTAVSAVIFCGDGRLVHATEFFITDRFGDAFIDEDFVFLPEFCFDPAVVFVDETDQWIAATDSAFGF
jgi:hypothetical protein